MFVGADAGGCAGVDVLFDAGVGSGAGAGLDVDVFLLADLLFFAEVFCCRFSGCFGVFPGVIAVTGGVTCAGSSMKFDGVGTLSAVFNFVDTGSPFLSSWFVSNSFFLSSHSWNISILRFSDRFLGL